MRTDLLLVTYHKDFDYLRYCLRSIRRFAKGFGEVVIMVPSQDIEALNEVLVADAYSDAVPIRPAWGYEWPEKGMLWHEYMVMMGDLICPEADFIAHFDPDAVFTDSVSPDTFIKDGKPILQYERFETITKRHGGVAEWKRVTEQCLPFDVEFETMRQLPLVYHRKLYRRARELMFNRTGLSAADYIRLQKNEFPQSFCEFVTLGNVAMHEFRDKYLPMDRAQQSNPDKGLFPVFQAWSHNPPDVPSHLWVDGQQRMVPALTIFKELSLA